MLKGKLSIPAPGEAASLLAMSLPAGAQDKQPKAIFPSASQDLLFHDRPLEAVLALQTMDLGNFTALHQNYFRSLPAAGVAKLKDFLAVSFT